MKILNFGSLNIDHVYEVPHFLCPGETLSSTKYNSFPGGKGLNQSIAMARSGSYVYHVGKIAADSVKLLSILQESGVDTTFLDTSGSTTGHAIIQVNPQGENCILLYGGSNLEISTDYIDRVFESIQEECILVLQNEISNLQYIIDKAKDLRMPIAFNPSPIDENLKRMDLSGITWMILNEIEGAELSGSDDSTEMTRNLLSKYPDMKIILTLGDKGAIYEDRSMRYEQPSHPAVVKDTTAAGDTFTGYFISEIASGTDIKKALDVASKAAAIAVSRDGASCSIPTRDEVAKM
jgi:ribokinase